MAGTIDSLDFEVILKDDKFKKSIENDLKLARELNTKLTDILNLKKRLNGETTQQLVNAEKVRQAEAKTAQEVAKTALQQQKVATEVERTRILQEKHTGAARQTTAEYTNMKTVLRSLSQLTGVAFSVVGLRRFLESLVDITGQFEVQRMALRSMLQDIDGADKIFEDLYRFSSDSTYRFSELAKYAKQLAAFNIDKGSLLETTKMLGDVASGVGVSMDRLILAYGHVKSSGFLRGIQLRSFSQNGVPILEELAHMFTETEKRAVSLGEVFDRMMKREIPFEMVEEAFKRMTSEGGKFYQMQEVLAKTLSGQINILKGRWENMLAAIGEANSGVLKDSVKWASNLISDYRNVGKLLTEMVSIWGAYRAALFLTTAVSEGLFAATFNLRMAMEKLAASVAANPYGAIALTVTALGTALYKLGTSVNHVYTDADKIHKSLTDGSKKYESQMRAENAEMERMFERLRLAKVGTDEYATAKKAIETRFGPYLEQLRQEGVEVGNLASIYADLAKKIEDANKQRFLESVTETAKSRFKDATDAIQKDFEYTMKLVGQGLSTAEQYDLWNYVMGGNLYSGDVARYNKLSAIAGKGEYKGEYSGPSYNHWFSVEELRGQYSLVLKAFNDTMNDADKLFSTHLKGAGEASENAGEEMVYKISSIVEGIKKIDKDIKEIRDKAKTGSITEEEKTALAALVADRKEQTDLYKEIMGVDYDKDTRNGESALEKATNKAISSLKAKITVLEKYRDIYEKIEPVKGEKTTSFMAGLLGGNASDYANLDSQILKLTGDLRELGEKGKEAAEIIEARLGLDAVSLLVKKHKEEKKAAEDAQKALDKYLDSLQKWADKTQDLSGTGAAYGISKAIADYRKTIAQNDTKFWDMSVLGTNAYKDSPADQAREVGRLMTLWGQNRANALAKLRNDITKYADDLFKEQMQGYDLTNWNDKTLEQINAIKRAVENVGVTDEIKDAILELENGQEILKKFKEELERIKGNTIDNTISPEVEKKWVGYVQKAAGYLSKAAESMRQLAEASGDAQLENLANMVQGLSETLSAAAEGYQLTGSWIGAAAGGVLSIVQQVVSAISQAKADALQLKNSVIEAMAQLDQDKFSAALNAENIFGENSIEEVRRAINQMDLLKDKFDSLAEARSRWYSAFYNEVKNQEGFSERFAQWRKTFEEGGVEGTMFFTDTNSRKGAESLSEIAERLGLSVYDEYGNLNASLLKKIQELYGSLNEGATEWLANAIAYSEEYAAAMTVVKDTIESIIGTIASDAADRIVEGWVEAKNAALDYADILDDVARAYAKLLIQDVIMGSVFDDQREKELIDAFGDGSNTARFMEMIAEDMQKIDSLAPVISDVLNALDPYFQSTDSASSSDTASLGSGIKSITEETASLLASYINAVRADVSFMRTLQEKGWENIEALTGVVTPTLAEYVEKIAANTSKNAQDAALILSELRSVIGPAGTSGDVVRVETV